MRKNLAFALCVVTAPPPSLHLPAFYGKYCSASGIPIVASTNVRDAALEQTAVLVSQMLAPIPAVRDALVRRGARIGIIGAHERTTDLPEYSREPEALNERARGLGGPDFTSLAEENVLCWERDKWRGENIFVHELGHTIDFGLGAVDPTFAPRLKRAFDGAMAQGKYKGRYAATNTAEYWAEGVQDYFGVHQMRDPTDINTKDQLRAYDPALFALLDAAFKNALVTACPSPSFSPSSWYRVTNASGALDTANDGINDPKIARTGHYSGQYWKLVPAGGGWFRLSNAFLGDVRSLDGAHMTASGAYSGQLWHLSPVADGRFRLTNEWQGTSHSLAVLPNGAVTMAPSADAPAQLWSIDAAR